MNNILYISDFLDTDLIGGGELNDGELCRLLVKSEFNVSRLRSHAVELSECKKHDFIIVSNFINLKQSVFEFIRDNCKYMIYEHDHKYLLNRNPATFEDYLAPPEYVINKKFYQNAAVVFCQTSFHKDIIRKNLNINNVHNVSGNLWSEDALILMSKLASENDTKNDKVSILHSNTPHKNTRECVFYCEQKKIDYELISSNVYKEFLTKLSKNKKFMFLPKTPETLSRVVVEARMMNVATITNKNVGACHEEWISMRGEELIEHMRAKKHQVVEKITEIIDEK
tara:strand:- start:302 stop:1150 length:849 start_codon:yes stop_codon:yes gene_type:complete